LIVFGVAAVTAGLVCYAFEHRSPWLILACAVTSALGSVYGVRPCASPFGLVEVAWTIIAIRRWYVVRHRRW